MIKHIVMWKVCGESPAECRANGPLLQREFESLRVRVPGLLRLEVGLDESRIDYACDVVLVSDFESPRSTPMLRTPEHLRVRRSVGDLRTARHQVDYAVQGPTP